MRQAESPKKEKGKRTIKPAANGTINKELAWVRRALKLGAAENPPLVLRVPKFEMLDVSEAVREGTVEHETYRAVRNLLPSHARIGLVLSYHTGMRLGELLKIRIEDVDLRQMRILLRRGTTKNDDPRYVPIYGDMEGEIKMAIAAANPKCPFLIQYEGESVGSFKRAWKTACKAVGCPAALFHDLRRTAVTNMIEAGLDEKEAMAISGHKTRNVFDRYHIVRSDRLRVNAEKLQTLLLAKDAALPATATEPGTVQ